MNGRPVVLTIAGSDSSGGAGIQGDLKTMTAFGVHGLSVVTAITAQDATGVVGWWPIQVEAVRAQLDAALSLHPAVIKTGMLSDGAVARAVLASLQGWTGPLVVDPVCRSSSGADLLDADAFVVLRDELIPRATVVTPNLAEAERLTGIRISTEDEQRRAAAALVGNGAGAALIKGGHLDGPARDVLLVDGDVHVFTASRDPSPHTHGTGCALASAIASGLALDRDLVTAVAEAKTWINGAIAAGYALGGGVGPIDHGWAAAD